ncbi:hypothetical protein KFL_002210200 [Klebsormidium nitens]|uniref:Uncharacterized protein n=1 Tax=Klebsormidium nitens TaxID=105231 RepID=A0A1Y1I2L4_KLENI|nr:hypothetical protein KFL_002210200 [Klebsormidium nitens]|eukprot:GAQ85154.1 hypothetical protein KFL_002210200 [Klebsormidium nitens]
MMASGGTKRPLEEQTPSQANAIAPPEAKKGRKPEEIKLQPIKKSLNDRVKRLAKMVDLDWHDGWPEQEEELGEYLSNLDAHFQSVYNFGVTMNTNHGDCHKILLIIADTWENMKTIPMRGTIECVVKSNDTDPIMIYLANWGKDKWKTFWGSPEGPLGYMWRLLLQSAAGNPRIKDEKLLQYIKDATDYNVDLFNKSQPDDDEGQLVITEVDAHMKAGLERLKLLHAQDHRWKSLPTHKKVHEARMMIDRRWDGPKHLRTRPCSDSDDDY